MTLNLAVQRVSVQRQDTLFSAFHSTLHGSEVGSPNCFVDSDVVCRHTGNQISVSCFLSFTKLLVWF